MLFAAVASFFMFMASESAPQQAAAVAPVIITYVFGRALENFDSGRIESLLNKIKDELILFRIDKAENNPNLGSEYKESLHKIIDNLKK